MKFSIENFRWTREPASFTAADDRVEIVTAPHTDLWQRTYYHFRNDNAPVFQMETEEKFFSFTVKTAFESKHRFDQCGIVMYLDSDNWLKGSIEFENENFSIWAAWSQTTATPTGQPQPFLRMSSLCGTVSAAGRMTTASNAPKTVCISPRCASAICGREAARSPSASTPAALRILPSRPPSPTWN